jgi:callose synthase
MLLASWDEHPTPMLLQVFMQSRGGTAKASQGINVSEDIYAGFTTATRGSESEHIEFLQLAKGKDTGFLQVALFEAKISGGSAIAFTSRDALRATEGMDFFRLMSYFHTGAGFFMNNVVVIMSLMVMVYYLSSMAISGLDSQVLSSNRIYLVGTLTPIEWIAQLGLLTVIPLFLLYWLENGLAWAVEMTLYCVVRMSMIFFMFGIQTKAYYFDSGLAFGTQSYLATGRNFVLRHLSFVELFKAIAHSHFYVGIEVLILLLLVMCYGTFASSEVNAFYVVTSWLFCVSNLFGAG